MAGVLPITEHTFKVDGLHCVKCIRKVQTAANQFVSIKRVDVDLGGQLVTTQASKDFPLENFVTELKKNGFGVSHVSRSVEKSKVSKLQREYLMKIGVAGACSGNIMILSVAEYSGGTIEGWPYIFKLFSLLVFLPVLLYAAVPLYKGAWFALKAKKISIDAPIALAIIGGFFLSVVGLIESSQAEVYFDSLSMFVFFLLSSRYLVQKIQSKYTESVSVEDIYGQSRALLVKNDELCAIDSEDVKFDDILSVPHGEYIYFDGRVESDRALISDAFYSGEAFPKEKVMQDLLYAGSKNVGPELRMRVTHTSDQSRLSQIVDLLNKSLTSDTRISKLADYGAKLLTVLVFTSASLILLYFGLDNFNEGINRSLALLVVACPCGLAIATPLVQTLAVRKAMAHSLLVKQVSALESISDTDAVFFDKTGTLTEGTMTIGACLPRLPSAEEKQILFALESLSEHPVAEAIRHFVGAQERIELTEFQEKMGQGVYGVYSGDRYSLEVDVGGERRAVFKKNDEPILFLSLQDQLGAGSMKLISYFRQQSVPVFILSGDKKAETLEVAKKLGVESSNVYFEKSPIEKAEVIKNYSGRSLYFGDGINDSLAMSYANVSVSTKSSADVAFKSSQIHILEGGVDRIIDLLALAKRSVFSMKMIVAVSLIYNILFAILAALGMIRPLIAVLIMPASSITVTFLGLYLMNKGIAPVKGGN